MIALLLYISQSLRLYRHLERRNSSILASYSYQQIIFHSSSDRPTKSRIAHLHAMQAFMQYRKIRHAVRKQVERDHEGVNIRPSQLRQVPALPSQDRHAVSTPPSATDKRDGIPSLESPASSKTIHTQHSRRTALGHALNGIHARERTTNEGKGGKVFVVAWEGDDDPLNPRNWSVSYRIRTTLIVASIAFVVGAASSTDTAILQQAAADFGVGDVVQSMAIGSCKSLPSSIYLMPAHRALSCRVRRWCGICGTVLRNIWAQRCLYLNDDHIHDIHHGLRVSP